MARPTRNDGVEKDGNHKSSNLTNLPAGLDRRELIINIQEAERTLYDLKIRGYPRGFKKELEKLEISLVRLRKYSEVYPHELGEEFAENTIQTVKIVAVATVAVSAVMTLPLVLGAAAAAAASAIAGTAVYKIVKNKSPTKILSVEDKRAELEKYHYLSSDVVAKSNILKNIIMEKPEFKSKEFNCARDFQLCVDLSRSSQSSPPILCALILVVCMTKFLIPFAGGKT